MIVWKDPPRSMKFLNEETCVCLDENLSDSYPKHSALFLCVLDQANKWVYMDYIKTDLFYLITLQPTHQKI